MKFFQTTSQGNVSENLLTSDISMIERPGPSRTRESQEDSNSLQNIALYSKKTYKLKKLYYSKKLSLEKKSLRILTRLLAE